MLAHEKRHKLVREAGDMLIRACGLLEKADGLGGGENNERLAMTTATLIAISQLLIRDAAGIPLNAE